MATKLPKSACFGRFIELKLHEHPDAARIGFKHGFRWDSDITIKVFTARSVLARCIRMQQKREPRTTDWKAMVELADDEGY
jgi:hypothetical protein